MRTISEHKMTWIRQDLAELRLCCTDGIGLLCINSIERALFPAEGVRTEEEEFRIAELEAELTIVQEANASLAETLSELREAAE